MTSEWNEQSNNGLQSRQHKYKVTLCRLVLKPNPSCPFLKRWGNDSMRMTVEKRTPQSQPDPDFEHREEKRWSQERNSHSAKAAENWVCSVCLCGACVWALIKDRRFFKHIRAILSNCFTPSSISTRTKDTDCSTKQCSPSLLCSITLSRPSTGTNRQGPEELCSCVVLVAAKASVQCLITVRADEVLTHKGKENKRLPVVSCLQPECYIFLHNSQ